jgi:hypothetical protein
MYSLDAGRMRAEVEGRGVTVTAGLRRVLLAELGRFVGEFPGVEGHLQVRLFAAVPGSAPCRGCLLFARLGRARRMVVASGIDSNLRRAVRAAFTGLGRAARRASGLARVALDSRVLN